jgi:DNA-binding transcriptional regulator PaaX
MSPYYKGVKVDSFGLPVFLKDKNSRAKKDNRKRNFYGLSFPSPFQKDAPKNLIVLYDIPEIRKKERDWFRRHLIKFGYRMIQRSVWAGPSPLPKDFLDYLKEIRIEDNFKTFKLAKPYDGKNKVL